MREMPADAAFPGVGTGHGGSGDGERSVAGVITRIEPGPEALLVIETDGEGEAIVRVAPGTPVSIEAAEGTGGPIGAAGLSVGARIVAEHAGVQLRSLPPQYQATRVRIVSAS